LRDVRRGPHWVRLINAFEILRGGYSAMISWAIVRVSIYLVLMGVGCPFLCAQSQNLKLYSDEQDLRRALSNLPTADSTTVVGNSPLKVYLNRGFGTQFNRPTSLTAVFCDRDTAFAAIEEGVSRVLSAAGYDVSPGWDKWGILKASKQTDPSARVESLRPVIFKSPLQCEDIALKAKIDQIGLSDRALTLDYTVLAGPRADRASKKDVSSEPAVEKYMDSVLGTLRSTAENALKAHCSRVKVSDFTSPEDAIQMLVQKLHLNAAQEKAAHAALRNDNEQQ
jgi:hypothetical protein